MTDPEDREEARYEPVLPFVVCKTQGGPYDDVSFVVGYGCGVIYQELQSGRPAPHWMPADSLPLLDLIAMRHGYVMTAEPWDEHPEQVAVSFERPKPVTL